MSTLQRLFLDPERFAIFQGFPEATSLTTLIAELSGAEGRCGGIDAGVTKLVRKLSDA